MSTAPSAGFFEVGYFLHSRPGKSPVVTNASPFHIGLSVGKITKFSEVIFP